MRHRLLWLTATLCVAAYCTPGRAAVTQDTFMVRSTGDLIELCTVAPTDPMGTAALNFCHGFGVGVYRVLEEYESARKDHMFCAPATMPTRNEALAGFVQWAKANPDQLSVSPQDGIVAYLTKQYPCARRK
jgi:hypothetical protein